MRDLQDWQHDRDEHLKEHRSDEICNDLNEQFQKMGSPEIFDLYRDWRFEKEFEDIDMCINYAIDNDEDYGWEIRL